MFLGNVELDRDIVVLFVSGNIGNYEVTLELS